MSTSRSPEELLHQVVLLEREGLRGRAIARSLGISRNTVRKLLLIHGTRRKEPSLALSQKQKRPRPSKLDAHSEEILRLFVAYPEITAQRVFEELRHKGFDGGYTQVKEWVRRTRPKPPPIASSPVEKTKPGQMAECDWSPYTVDFTTGRSRTVQAFGYALPYSHRKYYRFYFSVDLHALLDGHVHAFAMLGGAATHCKYDNQKPVVLRWEGRQPIYNLRFIDFCTYYEFLPIACRPGHPNDKPTVERSFWELERSFFNGRRFRDEADLALQLEAWRTGVCDLRPHKKSKTPRLDLFAEEKPHLRPLPAHSYDTARVVYRICDIEGFIAWDGNRYSLPYEHVTDFLPVRITQSELFVYAADLKLIARHELRSKGDGDDAILPGHHPQPSRRGPDLDQLRVAYDELDHVAARFLVGLISAQPRSAAYHARQILLLRQRYKTSDLEAALDHAARFGAFDHRAVERILRARAKPRALDEYVAESTAKKLAEVIAESRTEPRSLVEYDAIPTWPFSPKGESQCPNQSPLENASANRLLIPPTPPSGDPNPPTPTEAQSAEAPTSSKSSGGTSNDSD